MTFNVIDFCCILCSFVINVQYPVVAVENTLNKENESVYIKTSSGVLQGAVKTLKDGQILYSFQGIPFAQPPLGDLRFKDPKPFDKWTGVLNATKFRSGCVEMTIRQTTYDVVGKEDCLYLNVYTPSHPNKLKRQLPVMVWIYGGAFREGNAHTYEPDYLIKDNVIVVTFNYRVGYFGFLSTADRNAPGNYGMKDMVLALKWVKKNIHRFGGNPDKVTIFGESAGSAAVGYLMVSPLSKGLFNAAIMQSGSPLCVWALHRSPRKVAFDLGIATGITTNSSRTLLKYLREVDLPEAHAAMIDVSILNFGETFQYGGPFGPVVEPTQKNAFLTTDTYKDFKKGNFARVPVLMGLNSQESKFFASFIPLARPIFFLYDVSPSSLARDTMNIQSNRDKRDVGEKIKEFYFKSHGFISGTENEYAEFMSDDLFVRPVLKTAQMVSKYVPVYFYVYDYEGDMGKWWLRYAARESKNGNHLFYLSKQMAKRSRIYYHGILPGDSYRLPDDFHRLITMRLPCIPRRFPVKGVAHATEVWYLWRTYLNDYQEFENEDDKINSQRLVRLWTNFAKFGDPTPKEDYLMTNLTWPKTINDANIEYFYIGKTLRIDKNFKGQNMKFWDDIYRNYSRGPHQIY